MSESEIWKQELEALKALRARLKSVDEAEELNEASADIREYLKDEIDYIDKELKEIEEKAKKKSKEYEEYYNKLKETIEESEKQLEDTKLLSNEEIYELRYSRDIQMLKINADSVEVLKGYEECKKTLSALRRRKTEINERIKMSEALGLTYNEYKEIFATLRKTSIVNKIYAEKGLESIAEKKASERTQEEKELLNKAKEEIITEINTFRRENKEYSVLKIINAIYYSPNTKVDKVKESKEEKLPQEDVKNLALSMKEFPQKIKDSNVGIPSNVIEEAPKDMENSQENEKIDINELKPPAEKVTLFRDESSDDYYVRKYTVDRFKLTSAEKNEFRINGSLCYKISEKDVKKIKEGAKNLFSPYIAVVKEVSNEDIKIDQAEIPSHIIDSQEIKEDDTEVIGESIKKEDITDAIDNEFTKEEKQDEYVFGINDADIIQVIDNELNKEPPKEEEKINDGEITEVINGELDIEPQEEKQEEEKINDEEVTEVINSELDIEPQEEKQEEEKINDEEVTEVINSELDIEPQEEAEDNLTKEEPLDQKIIDAVNAALNTDEEEESTNSIIAEELRNEETTKKDINDMLTDEIQEIEDTDDLDEDVAINITVNKEFKKELSEGNTAYNIITSIPKLAKRVISKIKSFFEPVHEFDELEEEIVEEHSRQR